MGCITITKKYFIDKRSNTHELPCEGPIEGARVLARLDDEGGHPLLIERGFDRGRVLLRRVHKHCDVGHDGPGPSV